MINTEEENLIVEVTTEFCSGLDKSKPHSTKELFPTEIWEQWSEGFRRHVGRLISRLVTDGRLPLQPFGKKTNNHKLYLLV